MKNNDIIMDSKSYFESLIGGLMDEEEAKKEVEEMRAAKVGTIKPNCWKKIGEDEFIIYSL